MSAGCVNILSCLVLTPLWLSTLHMISLAGNVTGKFMVYHTIAQKRCIMELCGLGRTFALSSLSDQIGQLELGFQSYSYNLIHGHLYQMSLSNTSLLLLLSYPL